MKIQLTIFQAYRVASIERSVIPSDTIENLKMQDNIIINKEIASKIFFFLGVGPSIGDREEGRGKSKVVHIQ